MKRNAGLMVVVILVVVSVGLAQEMPGAKGPQDSPQMRGGAMGMMGQMGMMRQMMPLMQAPDVAAWDGNIYVLSGTKLAKVNSDLETKKTVELEEMPGMMKGMMGGQHRGTMRAGMMGDQGMQRGGMMSRGDMMQGSGMMQMMHGMHRGRMMSNARVTADAQGVYLLRGSTLTAYDHDLNEIRSAGITTVVENAAQCPMCRKMMKRMQQGAMMRGGMMMGGPGSNIRERPLERGMVQLSQRPATPPAGQVMFRVAILTPAGEPDGTASVNGFVYPKGHPSNGTAVQFMKRPGGRFVGSANLPTSGEYELAIRVKRADHEDAVVYYDLSAPQ